jgi:outer membrane receptor for ferrienterochelin and colicin
MSNEKQTSVEWYHQQIVDRQNGNGDSRSLDEILEQAKEMEKEQIKIAWNHGFDWGMMEQSLADQGEPSTLIDANHFYNETYGGK